MQFVEIELDPEETTIGEAEVSSIQRRHSHDNSSGFLEFLQQGAIM